MTIHTPNLPALIAAIPGDHTRAPQTEFTRERQVLFLENLSITGSVRSAAAAGGVSHQTAYRARRGQGAFRLAWDAAMVAARAHAAEVLAARAIDGVEEKVFYHGEHVDTRVRYSDRLLLAHLARLDRLVADPAVNAVAEDFDAALARFERGEEVVPAAPPAPAAGPASGGGQGAGIFSPGPCNTRSMSPADEEDDDGDDDGIDWDDEEACAAELERIEAAMAADRPADAPRLTGLDAAGRELDPGGVIADAQWQAFEAGVPRWWLVVEAPFGPGSAAWRYADAATLAALDACGPLGPEADADEDDADCDDRDDEEEPDEPEYADDAVRDDTALSRGHDSPLRITRFW